MFGKSLIFILQVAAGILWIPDIFIIATIFFGALHPEWASGWFLFEGTVFLLMLVFFIWSLKRADVLSLTTGLVRAGTAEEQKADRVLFWFDLNGTLAGVTVAIDIRFSVCFRGVRQRPAAISSSGCGGRRAGAVLAWQSPPRSAQKRAGIWGLC